MNKKYVSSYGDIAYVPFLDLAITFSVQERKDDSMMSYLLTNEDLQNMNVDLNDVKKTALSNTKNDRKKSNDTFCRNR